MYFPRQGRTEVRYYTAQQANEKNESRSSCCFWAMVVISFGLTAAVYSTYCTYKDVSKSLGDILVDEPGLSPRAAYAGSIVHIAAPPSTVRPAKAVSDKYFNIEYYGAFVLRREVEYCQWMEHQSTQTHKHSDGSETEETTYYYTKGWRSAPIGSMLFNQPGAHHNPQRNPYPPGIVDYTDVNVGNGYTIDSNLAKHVSVDTEYYIAINSTGFDKFIKSRAYKKDNFYYTNKEGWFYSPYTPSTAEKLAKMTVELMEGSLFDYQLADLFSECTAGDIRVRFRIKDPKDGVSLIGRQTDKRGRINTFKSIEDREVDIIYEGIHSTSKLKDLKVSDVYDEFIGMVFFCIVSWIITWIVSCVTSNSNDEQKYKTN